MKDKASSLRRQVKVILVFFMIALVLSGATAIPVASELQGLLNHLSPETQVGHLLTVVLYAMQRTQELFPFLLYGYDWLAFAHLVIAVAFIGPLREPIRNIWVIDFGLIACIMVLPFALVVGGFRELPFWWRLIDCSFGVFGFAVLWACRRKILQLEKLEQADKLNLVF